MALEGFHPHSSLRGILSVGELPVWWPEEEQYRIAGYTKYDELYWNDATQYKIRVLEGETPLYVPNPRIVVDTTAHYLLKGLQLTMPDPEKNAKLKTALDAFMKRERFYSRFHIAKHSGVARGDFVFHLTADPLKEEGTRIGLNSVDPAMVLPVYDEDDLDKLVRLHIVDQYFTTEDPNKLRIKKLTYWYTWADEDMKTGTRRVWREEGIYEVDPKWWGPKPKLVKQTLPPEPLDPRITTIPVYWFKNIDWQGQPYGSSDLRGFEFLSKAVSQAATDTNMSLALEGLGVYATDGGRPVSDDGEEEDWEVSPGKVMEVPAGSYFRRVEGVGSITPMQDQIKYLERKIFEAGALTDVARGQVDVQIAESGIALAIKFAPTLAKIEERDQSGIEILQQMFFDWKIWHQVYEGDDFTKIDILAEIGAKLPIDRTETINELNNMLDRGVISRKYYREQMQKLGYDFPADIEGQIEDEKKADAEQAALLAPPGLQQNAADAAAGKKPPPPDGGVAQGSLTPKGEGAQGSNNKKRPNESGGTEATQTLERQARGGRPRR